MLLGFRVSSNGVGTISRQFSIVGNTGCISSSLAQMIGNGCCHLFLLRGSVDGSDRFSCTLVQLCTPCAREAPIQMADNQWMPEVIGNLCVCYFFGQQPCMQGFL